EEARPDQQAEERGTDPRGIVLTSAQEPDRTSPGGGRRAGRLVRLVGLLGPVGLDLDRRQQCRAHCANVTAVPQNRLSPIAESAEDLPSGRPSELQGSAED